MSPAQQPEITAPGTSVLGPLGLTDEAYAVYRVMLARHDLGLHGIASNLGLSESQVKSALDLLAESNLVRRAPDGACPFTPVNPSIGLTALLATAEAEITARTWQIQQLRTTIAAIAAEHHANYEHYEVTRLQGVDRVRERLGELAAAARSECVSLNPNSTQTPDAKTASRSINEQLLRRGVSIRCIYQDSFRNSPQLVAYARWLNALGGHTRTVPVVPMILVLVDCETALLPLDPHDSSLGAIEVSSPGIVAAVAALFEQTWAQATPLGETAEPDDTGLEPIQVQLLKFLALGHTDHAVARQLGVSLSTVRRMMATLMDRLDARSRFQAGVHSSERGWIRR
jgi:DNA-binding CsgD family transcriptional regulator